MKTENSSKKLLEMPAKSVAIIGYRLSAAGNVNVMFGEVSEAPATDGGAFNTFYGSTALKNIRYGWQVMKPELAKSFFNISDASDDFKEHFLANPKAGDKYVKIKYSESLDSSKGDPITNPESGEISLDGNGNVIYRKSTIILVDSAEYQEPYTLEAGTRLKRLEVGVKSETESATPFSMDSGL
jgi:hypothetical protein